MILRGHGVIWYPSSFGSWRSEFKSQWPHLINKMPKTKKVKAAGRFGARYGRKAGIKITDIESKQRKKQDCIFCNGKAKRLSAGIWQCNKCKKKFASHAYYLPEKE